MIKYNYSGISFCMPDGVVPRVLFLKCHLEANCFEKYLCEHFLPKPSSFITTVDIEVGIFLILQFLQS